MSTSMAIPHHSYFEQVISSIQALSSEMIVAIVSLDGLVLSSNVTDPSKEAELSSFASTFFDYGKRMVAIPASTGNGNGRSDTVQTMVTVGAERFVVITHLLAEVVLIVVSEDKTRVNAVLKKSLEEIDRVNSLIQKKEILF
jgi:predicted regulator of Ras-like GTPase activity (Roadblock/LC7/MglB family)